MSEEQGAKTEEPSAKRLADSRARGQVAQSREVNHFFVLGAATVVVLVLAPMMMTRVMTICRAFLEHAHELSLESDSLAHLTSELLVAVAFALFVPMLFMVAAAVGGNIAQVGFLVSTQIFELDITRLSPLKGFSRLFSLRQVIELIKSMIKIALVTAVAYGAMWPMMSGIDTFVGADVSETLIEFMHLLRRFLVAILVMLLVLAVLDYLYQRWDFSRNQRMSKQELKDEFKQQEGDPLIKARLRKLRMERARKRMMKAVPTATVVVTNPTHYAVALKYDRTMVAPRVVAKGMDLIALRIRDIARENSVPVVENPPLARTLHAMVDIDRDIMPEHYKAVAEIISFVMKLRANAVGAARVGPPVR